MEGEVVKSRFKRVCVFCGSRTGKRKCYTDVAVELGHEWVHPKLLPDISLNPLSFLYVSLKGGKKFGPCLWWSIRLMGIVSKTVHRAGGNVIGIIPSTLMRKETHITSETVGEVRPAISGGYGTLEELLEVITWVQLGIYDKPISNNNMVIVELLRGYLPF
ncbi:hypothetical protein ES288_D07G186100v1 [Gossypium darwinii]|uniref:cytokinin riboside 5'-monophosphate phosphoribohydrolase n=1 Tax=Gossypium darwinii TaxID=34276 RepID=A0A5D2C1D4_GOSDA|nr:hypothetical protein ES288_D07G186100v1 [Gossypium darwinii]